MWEKVTLNKCECGCDAELVAYAPARARYDCNGNEVDMCFTDVPWYKLQCTECDLETDDFGLPIKAASAWNERKYSKWFIRTREKEKTGE